MASAAAILALGLALAGPVHARSSRIPAPGAWGESRMGRAKGLHQRLLEPLRVPGTSLLVDRPAEWWPGGVRGYGILVSLIGRAEGYPNFAVMSDPEAQADPESTPDQLERQLEALHEALLDGKSDVEVESAGWRQIHGLRVHDSLSSWSSVTGRLKARRVLLVLDGRPYVLTWVEREERYEEIAAVVERCVDTLRIAPGPLVGPADDRPSP